LNPTDIDIIQGCRDKNPEAQKALLEKHAGYLMAVIRRYCSDTGVAQDILQETWIQIFRNVDRYEENGKLKSWMARIAITQSYKQHRKKSLVDYKEECPDQQNLWPDALDNLNYRDLMQVVNRLKSPQRDVFVMYVIDGLKHKEIAKVMEISPSTSRVHLTNARKQLQKMIRITSITQ